MLNTILISVLIVAICLVFLGVKILFSKEGKFPNTHISGSKAMREKGIGCVQSQDREARKRNQWSFKDMEETVKNSLN
ncbi:hypothetical protein D0T50_01920 [Bacteroides sp. 214]|uniref:hypothetical protein n=1 Tax=Bacteroides sp. 214 TaxID=2302935 RepID=UPI0013D684E8|nr:hypothetical protein [Bacteroides sp. 214]NDW11644.1 hypothetical protein [Bacteroides sp. 214]